MSSFPSNDPSRGNNNKKPMSEEAAIYNVFARIISSKFSSTPQPEVHTTDIHSGTSNDHREKDLEDKLKRLNDLYQSPLYRAEKQKIDHMNNQGLEKGLLCGIGTFVFLRRSPRLITRYIMRQQSSARSRNTMNGSGSGGYTFDNLNIPSSSGGAKETAKPGILFRMIRFGVDVFLSTNVAVYATSYFMDRKRIMRDMSEIPLVEGKSLVSDELCDDFIDAYRHIPKRAWDKYESMERDEGHGDGVEALTSIGKFVRNCYRRHAREKEVRDENRAFGIMGEDEDDAHPPIPPPGVSPDIAVEIEWSDKSENVMVGKEREDEGDFYGFDEDPYFNNNSEDDDDHTKN